MLNFMPQQLFRMQEPFGNSHKKINGATGFVALLRSVVVAVI
jgi:hypothetical protein